MPFSLETKIADSKGYYPGEKGYQADQAPQQGQGVPGQDLQGQGPGPYNDGSGAYVPDGYGGYVLRQNPPNPPAKQVTRTSGCVKLKAN